MLVKSVIPSSFYSDVFLLQYNNHFQLLGLLTNFVQDQYCEQRFCLECIEVYIEVFHTQTNNQLLDLKKTCSRSEFVGTEKVFARIWCLVLVGIVCVQDVWCKWSVSVCNCASIPAASLEQAKCFLRVDYCKLGADGTEPLQCNSNLIFALLFPDIWAAL